MASSTADSDDPDREIRLLKGADGWVATEVEHGVTSQGETRAAALENLDEVVALHLGRSAPLRRTQNSETSASTPRRT